MSRYTFLFVVVAMAAMLFDAGEVQAGWVKTNSGIGQTDGVFEISTPEATTAYAVGSHNTGSGQEAAVWYTHNSGGAWTRTAPSTSPMAFYFGVFAPTANKAYVTSMRHVYITTDGGTSWVPSGDAGMLTPINGVGGFGEHFAVAVVSNGDIMRTVSGGVSWEPVTNPTGEPLSKVFFLNETYGWLAGGTYDSDTSTYHDGALLRTTDGGQTWEVLFSGEARGINAVSFINPNEGWLVSGSSGGATIEKTTDGGETWTTLSNPAFTGGTPTSGYDVEFFDRCEGWMIMGAGEAEGLTSSLFYTSDGGDSWLEWGMDWAVVPVPFPIPVRGHPLTFDFNDRMTGYTGGTYELLGVYTSELPDPDCGGADPDSWTDPDAPGYYDSSSGCGCNMVW